MENITFLRDISLLIGIWVAIYGIDSWRREHKGKREIELAEDVLALFYEARESVKYLRHPFSPAGECDDVEKQPNESESEWHARRNASVVFKRYNERKDLFNRLYAMRYRFMAQVRPDKAQPFEELNKIVHEVLIAARMLARLWPRNHFRTEEQYEQHMKQTEKHEGVLWEGLSDEDPINPRLDAVVASIDKMCRGIITGKGTLHGLLNRPLLKKSYRDRDAHH